MRTLAGLTASTIASGSGRASGIATSSSSTRRAGVASPELRAQHRDRARRTAGSASRGRPTPTTSAGAPAVRGRHPAGSPTSARSMPVSASSRRRREAPRIIVAPSRESPRSVSSLVRVTSVPPSARVEADLQLRGLEDALERRPLDVLLPRVAHALGRAGAAKVRPHAGPPLGPQHRGPMRPPPARIAHVLDPLGARPPARQAVRVRYEVPDPGGLGGDRPGSRDARHRAAQAIARRT